MSTFHPPSARSSGTDTSSSSVVAPARHRRLQAEEAANTTNIPTTTTEGESSVPSSSSSSLAGTGDTQDLTVVSAIGAGLDSAASTVGDAVSSLGDSSVGSAVGNAVGGAAESVGGAVGGWMGVGDGADGGDVGGDATGAASVEDGNPSAYFTGAAAEEGEGAAEAAAVTEGGGSITKEQYQSIHHHMQLCPGFEVFKVKGYADLEGLRTDLQNYFEFVRAGRAASEEGGVTTGSATVAPGPTAGTDTDTDTDTDTGMGGTTTTATSTSTSFATPLPILESGTNATNSSDISWDTNSTDGINGTVYPDAEDAVDPFFPTTSGGINGTDADYNATDTFVNDDAYNSTLPDSESGTTANATLPAGDVDVTPDWDFNSTVAVTATPIVDPVPALTCNTDVFQCDDFSLVFRDPSNDCRFESCSDGTVIPEEDNETDVADYDGNVTDASTVLAATEESGFDYDYSNGTALGDDDNNGTAVQTASTAVAPSVESHSNFTSSYSSTATTSMSTTETVFTTPAARKRSRPHLDVQTTVAEGDANATVEGRTRRRGRGLRGLQDDLGNGTDEDTAMYDVAPAAADGSGINETDIDIDAATTSPAAETDASDGLIQAGTPIVFDVCPNTRFDFANLPPLLIDAPVQNPVWINCRKDLLGGDPEDAKDACVFVGGKTHLVIYRHPDGEEGSTAAGEYQVTVRGFTFRQATETSILMMDPRGKIAIEDGVFGDNAGVATIHVDGKYDGDVEGEWWFPKSGGEDASVEGAGAGGAGGITSTTTTVMTTTTSVLEGGSPSTAAAVATTIATVPAYGDPTRNETSGMAGNVTYESEGNETAYYGTDITTDPFSSTSSTAWNGSTGGTTAVPLPGRGLAEVGSVPRAVVTVRQCSFIGNSGDATIMVNSFVDEVTSEEQDPGTLDPTDDLFIAEPSVRADAPHKHSIHLSLEDSTFTGENARAAVIMNDGARLQSSYCRFVDNTADSVIQLESGTLAIYGNEFTNNEVGQAGGPIQVDVASTLEASTGNCDKSASTTPVDAGGGEMTADALISARQGLISNITNPNDGASPAKDTDTAAPKQESTPSNTTVADTTTTSTEEETPEEEAPQAEPVCGISVLGVCVEGFGQECRAASDPPTGCISTWDALVSAVKDRSQTDPDFKICPGYTLDVGADGPVVIDADYTSIKCGDEGLLSDECTIKGGFAQFQVVGSPEGVELSGLTMQGSTGASVIAGGSKESTLRLRDCAWTQNTGASAILIRDNVETEFNGDTSLLLSSNSTAMSVEIRDCEFKKNKVSHGTVSNMGGTLIIYKNRFENNTALGGDVVVANSGTCKLQENCFFSHSSIAAGTIFVQEEAALSGNANNFGVLNAAGTFSKGRCNDIFQETNGTDCLAEGAPCNGFCMTFDADKCSLDSADNPNVPLDNAGITIQTKMEDGGKQNLTPIIVATVVAAFTVFGMAVIIIRRKQKGKKSGGDTDISNSRPSRGSKRGGMLSKFKRKKAHDTSAYEVEDDDEL